MAAATHELDREAREVLTHTLGVSRAPYSYRNHFVTDDHGADYPAVRRLVDAGLMKAGRPVRECDQYYRYYHATPAGLAAVRGGTVVSVRRTRPDEYADDHSFVYVGRAVPRRGWKDSPFGNPFREAALFSKCLDAALAGAGRPDPAGEFGVAGYFARMADLLPTLRGKALGCWCGFWEPWNPAELECHAVVLAKAVLSLPAPTDGGN